MKRLELARIRVCERCGRGGAELRGTGGEMLVVPLDAVRARQLSEPGTTDETRSLADLVLEQLRAGGVVASEVVIDAAEGRLRALLSLLRDEGPDVVVCTADEGVALAVRGRLKLYATDEALAHATARSAKRQRQGGAGGPDTVH